MLFILTQQQNKTIKKKDKQLFSDNSVELATSFRTALIQKSHVYKRQNKTKKESEKKVC